MRNGQRGVEEGNPGECNGTDRPEHRLLRGTLFVRAVISRYPFDYVHVKELQDPQRRPPLSSRRPLNYSAVTRGKSASSSLSFIDMP